MGQREGGQARREKVHVRIESSEFSCDDVEVRELRGKEAISALFSFHVDIVCPQDAGLDMTQMLGAAVSIVFEERDPEVRRGPALEVRRIHGMVAEVHDRLETESDWRSYHLWIVPRVWRSTLVETQEVYLDINVPDLIQQKLALVGLSGADVEMRLMGSYPVRELIAQYKETDVAFFSRLAEHLGISFFFEHDGGTDKIVFSDASSAFRPLQGAETLHFRPRGEKVDVFELEARSRAFPASFVMQEYNYRTPGLDLTSLFEAPEGFGGGVIEYGAHYKTPAEGAQLAQARAEERAVANQYYIGKSDISQFSPGGKFTLFGHARLEGASFLVVEVEHSALQTVKAHGTGVNEPYRNTFRVVDAARPYRPPRVTKRPRIAGVLTALVEPDPSGAIGELSQIDAEGRYTVKFYFDAGDVAGRTKNSRPVRMIQGHSGPNYGIHFPLKPGIEVLIVFMDGDPDRPLIVGSVPNPITPSPVVEDVNLMHRIETASGLIIEMRDAVPPHVK
jgi:type VI secretion system secreted protein VgrG